MVKIFVFLFSVYLLVLPGVSCAETLVCADETTQLIQAENHEEHQEEDCGSFCNCSCCVHIVSVNYQQNVLEVKKTVLVNSRVFFYCDVTIPSNYFGNIWQPPRLAKF